MLKNLNKRLKEVEYYIAQTEKSLKKVPEGRLVLSKSNGSVQYYHKTNHEQKKGEYISKKNSKLITLLAQKDYDLRFLKDMKEQKSKLFYSCGIPYRYEYPVNLKGYGIVYPDFTLLNVKERKEIYCEHFGLMDNPEYCQKAIQKIETYAKNGIYIGKNLLVTFETLQKALDMKIVEQMLKEFIL